MTLLHPIRELSRSTSLLDAERARRALDDSVADDLGLVIAGVFDQQADVAVLTKPKDVLVQAFTHRMACAFLEVHTDLHITTRPGVA